jgi:ribonuclease R
MNIRQQLLQAFEEGTINKMSAGDICRVFAIPYREKKRLTDVLDGLVEEGLIFQDNGGRYGTADGLGLIQGKISGNERGFAFLVPENKERHPSDYFLPRKNLRGALHGDTVLAQRCYGRSDDEAEIVAILERGYSEVVGTFQKDRYAGYLIPDEKRLSTEIFIPLHRCFQIKSGVKAVARITEYPHGKCPGGEIIEVLGDEEDFFAEELSIIRSFGLHEAFPSGVEEAAIKQEERGITANDLLNRRDFRNEKIVTIDGEDTRDIDDAVSLKKDGDDYLLGVHIADVSHYVKYRSPLDKEALSRGTSVYFPDRVLPMLPKALSNGICSLNEGEERLTLSCLMRINSKGIVIDSEIVEGVICSAHKMTYTEVTKILDGDKDTIEKYADVADMVCLFSELTKILQTMRSKKGSVTLDVKEAKIMLLENEIVIPDYKRQFSHEIIEAFMVLANETVAQYMQAIEAPFVYRVHEKPNEEKATTFRAFAQGLGLKARFNVEDVHPYDYQNLLRSAEDLPVYSVLNRVMLRSMQKAKYSPENVGHFGLASDCYCHFTSPIRRYPDLCIHRIIKDVIQGKYAEACEVYGGFVQEAADKSSDRERNAAEAEREVDALYTAMYMSERIGEEYLAIISGVTSHGIFAELPNTVEGFVPVESIADSLECIPEKFLLKGKKESYSIGESIRVKVVDVDFYRRRTVFELLEKVKS